MMTLLVVPIALAVLAAATAPPTTAAAAEQEGVCPTETAKARSTLVRYLTGAGHAEERERHRIPPIDTAQVRLLTDSTDERVCGELNKGFAPTRFSRPPYRVTYFAAGEHYLAAITNERQPGEGVVAGHHPSVVVFDRELIPMNLSPAPD